MIKNRHFLAQWARRAFCSLLAAAAAASVSGQVIISEFCASNSRGLADQDGDNSDWIELYNTGKDSVNLANWSLTDDAMDLRKWRFPAVSLPPDRSLVVFASDKNRRAAGAELHTNFRLSGDGEFLALVLPDGATTASVFRPSFPPQITDISYGLPMTRASAALLASGAAGKFLVPANDALGAGWTQLEWPDSGWSNVVSAVGFSDGSAAGTPTLIADSIADFSGVQGEKNWRYGYYNRTADTASPGYGIQDFTPFPRGSGGHGAGNFWTGGSWNWFNGDPPWTEIAQEYVHPNGVNSGAEHWVIRRWVSSVSGTVTARWRMAKEDPNGRGVTGRVFHQGVQKDLATIAGSDLAGVDRTVTIPNVAAGDVIDFALSPGGQAGTTDDGSDGSKLSAQISVTQTLAGQIAADVGAAMRGVSASAYLRLPFQAEDPSKFENLSLRVKYDDGFVAYLNGLEVARRNAPDTLEWNSVATAKRDLTSALQWEEIDLSSRAGLLRAGANVLAIHGLNAAANDPTFLLSAELSASGLVLGEGVPRYFTTPTPGAVNGEGRTNLGPLVVNIAHTPAVPAQGQGLAVTARALPTFEAVASLALSYRVMYGTTVTIPMLDDGAHGDGARGDGVYGAVIPANAATQGQMIRYFIMAADSSGDASRWPAYTDPAGSPQYFGTIVLDTRINTALPVFHWFIQNASAANNESGARASVFYNGEFYDNVGVNLHGQSSAAFPKKSYDFDFNSGHHLSYAPDQQRMEDVNLLTTYPDKAHMRNLLAYETYRDAGAAYHIAFPVRVQQNGAFFSDAHFVEDGDEDFLARLGLDPNGALYKMYNTLDSATSSVEKKTRKSESNADLQALVSGVRRTGAARAQYLYDNVNIPAMVNYLAAMIITGGTDCCHKNYYAYFDTEGSREWRYLPWDVDLTFGRNWNPQYQYFDDTMFEDNPLYIGNNNSLVSALFAVPAIKQMYLRRVRTLMDELLQPRATPASALKYEKRIEELSALIGPDAALDFAKWPTWGQRQTLPQAVAILTNEYFPARRSYLYNNREIPAAQAGNLRLAVKRVDFNPASGNQDHEFIEISNTNAVAVDVSGWRVTNAVVHALAPGTVLPAGGSLYLSPQVAAFRQRPAAPTGSQSLFAQGNYQGRLSARGETVQILDAAGREAAVFAYAGAPTLAQQFLRVTEIMYSPAPLAGSGFPAEDFEFLQLKNIGTAPLPLAEAHFTDGITFAFLSGTDPLAPSESVYLAKNPAAFAARYGAGFKVAGPYEGSLNNAGEKLRLADGAGEEVLEFEYNNAWFPLTDGGGYSLVLRSDSTPWNDFDKKTSWQVSELAGGTPASPQAALAAWKALHFWPVELSNPAISGDDADPDNDGMSNLDEYLSGTLPRDGGSRLGISAAFGAAPNTLRLRFAAAAGKSYSIQYTDSMTAPVWRKLSDVPAQPEARLAEATDTLTPAPPARYYRVVTPAQP